jgi:Fe-Mn family superoxide dismutase
MNRRTFLSAGCSVTAGWAFSEERPQANSIGVGLKQEPLGFALDQLEPHLDAENLRHHYEVIHTDYSIKLRSTLRSVDLEVANLSNLITCIKTIPMPANSRSILTFSRKTGPLPEEVQADIRHFGGGHQCHTVFWRFLAPPGTGPKGPEGRVAEAIQGTFGSIEDFKRAFTQAALSHVGDGWAWLVHRPDGKLVITTTSGNDHPRMKDFLPVEKVGRPLLCLDLWDHAYHPKYKGQRENYIAAWWNVVNWSFMSRAYAIVTSPLAMGSL